MKTDLDHLRPNRQRDIEYVTKILRDGFDKKLEGSTADWKRNGKIQRIVLFGSYAKGTFVEDHISGYHSDFDILIIVNDKRLTDFEIWHEAQDKLTEFALDNNATTNFIVHTLQEVNDHLAKGQYFFSDIVKDGVLLYEATGTKVFAKAQDLPEAEALAISKEYFDFWYISAQEFYDDFVGNKKLERNNKSVFELHQATERLYNCLLLTVTHYSPDSHNLVDLRSQSERFAPELIDVWPRNTKVARRNFQLLKRAYVEARYSKHYVITTEELEWLGARVKHLSQVVKDICETKLKG